MPKYVVSSTLEHPDWNNSRVLPGHVVTEVSKLKRELDGEIVVPASYQLGRTLIEHDLVDELRLVVFPVVLGTGERLFGDNSDKKPMRLVNTRTIGDGLAFGPTSFTSRPRRRGALTVQGDSTLPLRTSPSSTSMRCRTARVCDDPSRNRCDAQSTLRMCTSSGSSSNSSANGSAMGWKPRPR